ncbi:SMP-30/Gluconolactonase/LRE-like region domain-containing protein [Plasmodiophora brassicae]
METFAEFNHHVNCIAVDPTNGSMVAALDNGDIVAIGATGEDEDPEVIVRTGGDPCGVTFDSTGRMFIADTVHKAILTYADGEAISQMVDEYDSEPFKGPHSLVMHANGTIFFTDCGPIGTTSLARPTGSVFAITGGDRILVPIILNSLAHPTGICLSPDQMCIYVAETGRNRLLRLVQSRHSTNVFHSSVFYQFQGGFGPVGVAVDATGNIYVTHYDFDHLKIEGSGPSVSVLSPRGALITTIPPTEGAASEVKAIAWGDLSSKNAALYIGESTVVYKCPVSMIPVV